MGTTGSSIEPHCSGLRMGGSPIHTCGPSFFEDRSDLGAADMCNCVWTDTESSASPAMPGSLDMVSRNLAATCEAEAPCSVNTDLHPVSSLTLSRKELDTPLVIFGNVSPARSVSGGRGQ